MFKHKVWAVGVGLALMGAGVAAQSVETGVIAGVVRDAERGGALAGAAIRVEGSSVTSVSDRTGAFRLIGVPVGERQVAVSFLGRATTVVPVTVDAVGGSEAEDVYYDNHTQLDINLSQQIGPRLQLFADFLNLTNAPLRYYVGTTNRPIQEEYYRWWTTIGAKVHW